MTRLIGQLIMALTFFMGLRKGEIQGLQWGDIDIEYIHVRRNIYRGQITTPETNRSVRSIPVIHGEDSVASLASQEQG